MITDGKLGQICYSRKKLRIIQELHSNFEYVVTNNQVKVKF